MAKDASPEIPDTNAARLRARDVAVVWACYLVVALIVSYPLLKTIATTLPGSLLDPLQHLWVMRWYRTCLLEWRSPLICPEIQYPVGAPLGNFSPLHMQSLAFIPISLVVKNDVLAFNLVWLLAMTTTGLGTFALAWQALRDKPCAAFAGVLAMTSTPMLLHARAHLELISLGGFPLFLAGWMRFVDRPTPRRLLAAAALYVALAMCAAYHAAFAIAPASLYVWWPCARRGRAGASWLFGRSPWLLGFAATAMPALTILFANQIWAGARGYAAARPLSEFNAYGSAPWAFLIPTPYHRLSQFLPANVYAAAGYSRSMGERASYLGLVTIVLIHQAAVRKEPLSRRGYFWVALASLVLMAWGGELRLGDRSYVLPSGWFRAHVPGASMLRVPARYNLLAGVIAAVIAGAGLKGLLARVRSRAGRLGIFSALAVAAVLDLGLLPFPAVAIPTMPGCYRAILDRDPGATFLEVPQHPSTGSVLSSIAGFWQSTHRGHTSAGYSGNGNAPMDERLSWNSPFRHVLLDDQTYLDDPDSEDLDIVRDVAFSDYAWLYLRANGYRYVVLHDWAGYADGYPRKLAKIKRLLETARVYRDDRTAVYDRERLAPPARPVVMTTEGWRGDGRTSARVIGRSARLLLFIPSGSPPLSLGLDASAFRHAREVRLKAGSRELARWTIAPDPVRSPLVTPSLPLPSGLVELSLECDPEDTTDGPRGYAFEADPGPYSLRVRGLWVVREAPDAARIVSLKPDVSAAMGTGSHSRGGGP